MKLIVLLGALWIGTAHAEVRFDRALVPSGSGWWCVNGLCDRLQKACEQYGAHCKKQEIAYAFIDSHQIASVSSSAADCETTRKDFATREQVSACVAVGVVPPKPYKPLEPGDGFWCFGVTMTKNASSMCMRKREVCEGAYSMSKQLPDTTMQSVCTHQKSAWAYMMESDRFRVDSAQYQTKAHCVQDSTNAVAPCREVR